MQRFVAVPSARRQSFASSPVTRRPSLVLSTGQRPWIRIINRRIQNVAVPSLKAEFPTTCCHQANSDIDRRGEGLRRNCPRRTFAVGRRNERSSAIRSFSHYDHIAFRNPWLPNCAEPIDSAHHHNQQHRGGVQQRNRGHVADSFRDFASESWWTDHADDESDEDDSDENDYGEEAGEEDEEYDDGGTNFSAGDLWTSRIALQLSPFWNLLGLSPSKIDEWIVSNESRRRVNSWDKQNFPLSSSSSHSFSGGAVDHPLGDLFERGLIGDLRSCLSSVRLSKWLSVAATPLHWPRDCLRMAMETLHDLICPRWSSALSQTYGASFMFLVALGYATQGFRCFPWFAVGYMLKDGLQVDPGYMQFLLSTAALPMVAKPIYGIISDTVYIGGAHRVPYLAISGILQLMSWGALALSPTATSSAVLLTAALTFGNLGAAIADVMNDALVAEMSKKQKGGQGELQSFAWLIMASGGLLGNLLGGFALKNLPLTSMYFAFLILLSLHLVTCLLVNEKSLNLAPPTTSSPSPPAAPQAIEDQVLPPLGVVHKRRSQGKGPVAVAAADGKKVSITLFSQLEGQVRHLGQLLKKKEISRMMLWFCASYAVVPVLGSSVFYYQTQVLKIDPTFIGFSRMVGQVGLMVGSQLYSGALKGLPLRKLLGSVQLLLSLCMLSDLVLVKRINLQLGIPDEFYVLGASALVDCVSQFKVLPVIVRLGQLCPPGSEGSLMAFFSSCHCLAGLCSGYFGVALAQHLQISNQSFEGLPLGIFIQAMFTLLPILCLRLIPGDDDVTAPSPKDKVAEKMP